MKTITATIITAPVDLPPGLTPGSFEVTLSLTGLPDVVYRGTEPTATFADLGPGNYTVTALRLATTGERLSAPVSAGITIAPPVPTTVDVPQSITLTLA